MRRYYMIFVVLFGLSGCTAAQDINSQEQYFYDAIDTAKESEEANEIVTEQTEAINKIKEEYSADDYTFDNPYIKVNPYLYNDLSAYVIFESDSKITYSYSVKSKENSTTPDFTYSMDEPTKGTIIIPVVALYENYDNVVTISVTDGEETTEQTVTITTEAAPDNYEQVVVQGGKLNDQATEADKETYEKYNVDSSNVDVEILDDSVLQYFDNGFLLLDTYDIYDIDGNLRFSSPTKTLGESGLKMSNGRFFFLNQGRTKAYYADLMGKIYSEFKLPEIELAGTEGFEFHHDSVITPDGKYVYALAGFSDVTLDEIDDSTDMDIIMESFILKFDAEGGYPVSVFDVTDYFGDATTNDRNSAAAISRDPIHMNSIDYYEEQNQLIISAKRQSQIFALDADNGELIWEYKYPSEVLEQNEDKLLEVTNPDEFKYTSGNHTAFIMRTDKYMTTADDLYISVFNNNNCLESENTPSYVERGETSTCEWNEYSAMEIYHIVPKDMTITLEEEIIPDDTRWSYIMSSVFTTHAGIYELNYTMMDLENGQQLFQPDFLITDEEGTPLLKATYYGLGMVYRSRLISGDEISQSLNINVEEALV